MINLFLFLYFQYFPGGSAPTDDNPDGPSTPQQKKTKNKTTPSKVKTKPKPAASKDRREEELNLSEMDRHLSEFISVETDEGEPVGSEPASEKAPLGEVLVPRLSQETFQVRILLKLF